MSEAEIRELVETVKNLTAQLEKAAAQNEQLAAENAALHRKLERMNELLLNAQRAQFGQSSEKRSYVLPAAEQLRLFNEAEAEQDIKAAEPTEETFVAAHNRRAKRTMEERIRNLPVKETLIKLHESMCTCGRCGGRMKPIGKKLAYRELEIIPRQVFLNEVYVETYACEDCERDTGFANVIRSEAPERLLKHSLASPNAVADVMTQKYVDGVPLARQEKVWARDGVELSRNTLANWVIQVSQRWLKPLVRQMKRALLEANVIHADETVVQVLKEPGRNPASESRMWVYASGERSPKPVRYFEYQPDRSGKHPAALLKDFRGCLVTDGYAGYNRVEKATRCGCWAHMRRKWREAMPKGTDASVSKAAVGFEYCNKLFALERKWADHTPFQREVMRKMKAEPLLETYWSWVERLDPQEGSKLAEAVGYARNQKEQLNEFLRHGDVPISNNLAENAIRPFVVGRKNWLFSDTPRGAESSAIVYTLVETAKANGVEPSAYLRFVLDQVRFLGKSPPAAALEALLPWSPAVKGMAEKYR